MCKLKIYSKETIIFTGYIGVVKNNEKRQSAMVNGQSRVVRYITTTGLMMNALYAHIPQQVFKICFIEIGEKLPGTVSYF